MPSYRFSVRGLALTTVLLVLQPLALLAQSAVTFKDVKPNSTFTELKGDGYTLGYPDNWKANTGEAGSLIAPPAAVSEAGISYGVIVGTNLSSEADSLDEAVKHLSQGLLQQNSGMSISGEIKSIKVNGVEGRALELMGNSPLQANGKPLPEHDWVVALPRAKNSLLYLVFVSPERDFAAIHPTYQKMLDSIHMQPAPAAHISLPQEPSLLSASASK
ncbi:MAG TPA: hypothetical protein VGN44_03405 [Candidatus Angelobacter sp.]